MVRPNGSVIGRNSSGEFPLIQYVPCSAESLRRRIVDHVSANAQSYGTLPPAYNPHPCGCGAVRRRPISARRRRRGRRRRRVRERRCWRRVRQLPALGGFGFFGRIGFLAARGGGPAGRSSATTGLGSTVAVAGVGEIAGRPDHLDRNRDRLELGHREGDGESRCRERAPRPSRGSCSPVRPRWWHRPLTAPIPAGPGPAVAST